MFKKHTKTTIGFVTQTYITFPNGTMVCTNQEFIAGDQVDYNDDNDGTIEVDTTKEVYCSFEMKQPKQVATDGLKFVCPKCQGTRLECCENGPYNSEVLNIDGEGDFDFGDIGASGDVDRFQCLDCGFVLELKEEGYPKYTITEHEEVVKWIKLFCKQD